MILKNDKLEVRIKPEGAEIISIKLDGYEYLWSGDEKYWGRHAPILFPIVGKLKNDRMFVSKAEYVMKQHGFARDSRFEEIGFDDKKAEYLLKYNEDTLRVYPYKFELYVTYELIKNKIKVIYEVRNKDDKNIFFSIGGHPAFKWPLVDGEKFEDYYIEFEKSETQKFIEIEEGYVRFKENLILDNENKILLSKEKFSIDTFIFSRLNSKEVSLKSEKSNRSVSLHFDEFPFLGIWSKYGNAEFICLEPWFGIADKTDADGNFEEKFAIQKLEVGKEFSCSYEIEII